MLNKLLSNVADKDLIFNNPEVSMINMMGQNTFQVIGEYEEKQISSYNDDDIKTVIEETNCSKETAIKALEKTNGDIAEAILHIKDQE